MYYFSPQVLGKYWSKVRKHNTRQNGSV